MLYFVLDDTQQIKSSFNVILANHVTYLCPFCNSPLERNATTQSCAIYYTHTQRSDCTPTLTQQIYYFLLYSFPCDIKFALPKLQHTVNSMTLNYPHFPDKSFTFPEEKFVFSESIIEFKADELVDLKYPSHLILAFHAKKDSKSYVFVFNFFSEPFDKDLIDEKIFYNSTVVELDVPNGFNPDDFRFGITVNKIIDMCRATYLRSEVLLQEIQKAYIDTREKHVNFVESQSKNILSLVDAGILKFRRRFP